MQMGKLYRMSYCNIWPIKFHVNSETSGIKEENGEENEGKREQLYKVQSALFRFCPHKSNQECN